VSGKQESARNLMALHATKGSVSQKTLVVKVARKAPARFVSGPPYAGDGI
jgi:hypothetical protein